VKLHITTLVTIHHLQYEPHCA